MDEKDFTAFLPPAPDVNQWTQDMKDATLRGHRNAWAMFTALVNREGELFSRMTSSLSTDELQEALVASQGIAYSFIILAAGFMKMDPVDILATVGPEIAAAIETDLLP